MAEVEILIRAGEDHRTGCLMCRWAHVGARRVKCPINGRDVLPYEWCQYWSAVTCAREDYKNRATEGAIA